MSRQLLPIAYVAAPTIKSGRTTADEQAVPPKTRLDPVVRLEESREKKSLQALADANRGLSAAELALASARAAALAEHRAPGVALHWEIADLAHGRARTDLVHAERAVNHAQAAAVEQRTKYLDVRARAEALRRLVETRRQEGAADAARLEIKASDDLQIQRHRPRAA